MNASTRLAALPEFPAPVMNNAAQFLRLPVGVERRALHLLQPDPDAGGVEVVHDRFGDGRKARDRGELAGVDPVRIAGFGEQLLGLRRIVGHRLDLQCEIHDPRNDDPGRRAEAEATRLVDRLAVERVVGREPQPLVVPR